ncbi:MAG TPA: PAS domain S-box protein [Lacipirellulaceae bacterium]|nr:PAS domain S-box protein [Lacipirellulaceae bacterium]
MSSQKDAEPDGPEESLRESEARQRAILATALDCIITIDRDDRILEFNPAAERTFGYRLQDVVGKPMSSLLVPPQYREAHTRGMRHYLATGEGPVLGRRIELEALRADGSTFPVELAITPIPTAQGPIFTAYLRDITERKAIEQRLREVQSDLERRVEERTQQLTRETSFLQAVLENIEDAVVACDSDGVLTLFNRATKELHGLPVEPIPPEQWADRYRLLRADGVTPLPTDQVPLYRALAGEHVKNSEMIVAPHDGPPRTLLASGQPLFDGGGRKIGAVVSMHDITDRKQAEEARADVHRQQALRRTDERLTEVLERINDGFVILDDQWRIVYVNPAAERINNQRREDLLGRNHWELYPETVGTTLHETYLRVARERVHVHFESYYAPWERWFELDVYPTNDGGIAVSYRDVTERKQSDAQREFLQNLAAATQPLIDFAEVTAVSARMLRQHLDCDRCAYAEVEDESVFVITGDDTRDVPSIVGRWPVAAFGKECARLMLANEPYVLTDSEADARVAPEDLPAYRATRIRSVICVPLHKSGQFTAAMAVHQKTPRAWTAAQVELVQLVVSRCWESLERARVTRNLLESEARFRQLANTIPQLAWMASPDGWVFWYNDRWYEYTGTTPADMEGWGWQRVHDPATLPAVMERWTRSIENGIPFDMTFPLRGADGVFRPFLTRVNPLRDAAGRVHLWFGTNTDVSERVVLEQRFRTSADSAPVMIWISDLNQDRIWFNKAWLDFSGRTMDEELSHPWCEGVHADDYERCLQAQTTSFESRLSYKVEYRLRRRDGEWRWVINHGAPLYEGPNGAFSGYVGSCIDITDLKAAEEERRQLLEAERAARNEAERIGRMKDEFLATLSHELRTPLNAILGYATLLDSYAASPEDVKEAATVIQRNAKAQAQIIEDLLDMNRIIAGKIRLDVQQVSLPAVIQAAVETIAPSAQAREIRLQTILDPRAGPVRGDPARLQQVVWNLLSNAVKFTDKGGAIQVLLERVDSHVEIAVVDSGQGIPADFLPHVFDRFRQADSSTTRRHGGLGLGLAIVKQLVEAQGGSVGAKSGGVGQGATFVVSLPLSPVHDEPAAPSRVHPLGTHDRARFDQSLDLSGAAILVVDDERDSCQLVKRVLEACGAEVEMAFSAPQALALLASRPYHVLISDIGMPGEDGYELLRRVRALPAANNGQIPAIALTAFARSEDRRRAALVGFHTHVAKPVEPAELAAIVAGLAGKVR